MRELIDSWLSVATQCLAVFGGWVWLLSFLDKFSKRQPFIGKHLLWWTYMAGATAIGFALLAIASKA